MNAVLTSSQVALAVGPPRYPAQPPFSPAEDYPEHPFPAVARATEPNPAYAGVRQALRLLGLDADRFGGSDWNPLGVLINPGDTVVLKPNFVRDFRETQPGHGDCLITHGAVIRAVADYVYLALQGSGRLIIADAPQNDADFDEMRRIAGLDTLAEFYRTHARLEPEIYDLRPEAARKINGVIVGHTSLAGDPAGYVRVNLGRHSAFAEINELCHRLYGSEYDQAELHEHHHDDVHEYLISRTVLDADCVISLPKLKTHKKTGLTVNLKNLVGINGNKNWLPHHREGTPAQGGDQYADNGFTRRFERRTVRGFRNLFPRLGPLRPLLGGPLARLGKRVFGDTNHGTIRSGNWYGNDTTWRMVIDLNRVLLYADTDGNLSAAPRRKFFSIVDGIIAGEGNGPLDPTPKPAGLVLAGGNPVAVDLTCARLMGFDCGRLPVLQRALLGHPLPLTGFDLADVSVHSNAPAFNRRLVEFEGRALAFRPHFGWTGHIELAADPRELAGQEDPT